MSQASAFARLSVHQSIFTQRRSQLIAPVIKGLAGRLPPRQRRRAVPRMSGCTAELQTVPPWPGKSPVASSTQASTLTRLLPFLLGSTHGEAIVALSNRSHTRCTGFDKELCPLVGVIFSRSKPGDQALVAEPIWRTIVLRVRLRICGVHVALFLLIEVCGD